MNIQTSMFGSMEDPWRYEEPERYSNNQADW